MTSRPGTLEIASRVEIDDNGCWLWQGHINNQGYPRVSGKLYAHRASYEHYVGPIPPGYVIDHLCRVPRCVNPAHLEAVTQRENNLRGFSPGAIAVRTNRCRHGHDLAVHGYVRPDGQGRLCMECQRIRKRRNVA